MTNAAAVDKLDPLAAAQLVAGAAADVTLLLDAGGVITHVSVADGERPIEDAPEWIGRRWVDTVTPETRGKVEAVLREVATRGASRRRQVNHPTAQGPDVPVAYAAVQLGRLGGIMAVGRDLRGVSTLQQRLVEAQQSMERDYWRLRHVETRYRLLFQLASEAVLLVDAATMQVVDANAAAGELFGEPTQRLVGRTFPFGVAAGSQRDVEDAVATARASGRAGDVRVALAGGAEARVAASCFRQDAATFLLVRFATQGPVTGAAAMASPVLELLERAPDAFVVTDADGTILSANRAFLDLAQLASAEQARGEPLGNWIGRPGADLPVFLAMLKRHGAVRLALTSVRGEHGASGEIEVSAAGVLDGDTPCVGFILRDVGRRLAASPQGARDLTRAVEQLTNLVGRVSLRELVRDTIDLVERHFIEAALELTDDNRTSAAEVLGVSRQSLYVKMRRHKLLEGADADLAAPELEDTP